MQIRSLTSKFISECAYLYIWPIDKLNYHHYKWTGIVLICKCPLNAVYMYKYLFMCVCQPINTEEASESFCFFTGFVYALTLLSLCQGVIQLYTHTIDDPAHCDARVCTRTNHLPFMVENKTISPHKILA